MRGIWNTSPARLGLPGIVAGVLGSLMASSACATTYLYVGQPYTSVGYYDGTATPVSGPAPAPYGPAMRVTGSFTTNARLPANLGTLKNIGPTGLNLMNGWKFNDGLLSYADGNSALVPTISGRSGARRNQRGFRQHRQSRKHRRLHVLALGAQAASCRGTEDGFALPSWLPGAGGRGHYESDPLHPGGRCHG